MPAAACVPVLGEDEGAVCVCLCNALTDARIKQAVADGACRPRDAYAACGCRARCGGCAKAVLGLIRDARATETHPRPAPVA